VQFCLHRSHSFSTAGFTSFQSPDGVIVLMAVAVVVAVEVAVAVVVIDTWYGAACGGAWYSRFRASSPAIGTCAMAMLNGAVAVFSGPTSTLCALVGVGAGVSWFAIGPTLSFGNSSAISGLAVVVAVTVS
jgi:hypothetical protein